MIREKCLTGKQLESIANILSQYNSHADIVHLLNSSKIDNVDPNNSKAKKLYNAFAANQNRLQASNNILKFISLAMSPESHTEVMEEFKEKILRINKVLAFSGYELQEDGKIHRVAKATNITDAVLRAQRFKELLQLRNVHPDVIEFASEEIKVDNYFRSVLEAMKSITSKVRTISNCSYDGADLVDYAFSGSLPRFVINRFMTKTEQGEQKGFVNLLKGLYGTFRNPTAHEPKIEWQMSEQDALDILSTISLIHRKLDNIGKLYLQELIDGITTQACEFCYFYRFYITRKVANYLSGFGFRNTRTNYILVIHMIHNNLSYIFYKLKLS